ncbi:MAG: type I 3-dehydroquinate dehydratase [Methanomicrobiales archaeon]|nr:type I 3-dehydroquinate dehydratase [Methanomicrobiales archaeon]
MKIVVSIGEGGIPADLAALHPDLLEVRLDTGGTGLLESVQPLRQGSGIPVIATLRSRAEGGRFTGDEKEWIRILRPLLPLADHVDVELRFRRHATEIRNAGKQIIASCHLASMPDLQQMKSLERDLRSYGDIPKIVVTPRDQRDLLALFSFTMAAEKPLCTGVSGEKLRYARALLPLFGSELVYAHAGTPTAAGQYHIREFRDLWNLLTK